jgi:hypothetical protein
LTAGRRRQRLLNLTQVKHASGDNDVTIHSKYDKVRYTCSLASIPSKFIAGLLFGSSGAEIINVLLNQSVIFLREPDVILSSDCWNAVISYDLTTYEEVINVLRTDLAAVKTVAQHTTSVGETRHVETALYTLESQMETIRRFAPKENTIRRRRIFSKDLIRNCHYASRERIK